MVQHHRFTVVCVGCVRQQQGARCTTPSLQSVAASGVPTSCLLHHRCRCQCLCWSWQLPEPALLVLQRPFSSLVGLLGLLRPDLTIMVVVAAGLRGVPEPAPVANGRQACYRSPGRSACRTSGLFKPEPKVHRRPHFRRRWRPGRYWWRGSGRRLGCWSAKFLVSAAAQWSVCGRSGNTATVSGFSRCSVGPRTG